LTNLLRFSLKAVHQKEDFSMPKKPSFAFWINHVDLTAKGLGKEWLIF